VIIVVYNTGPFAVIEEHMTAVMPNCYDAIGLLLMIHLTYQHQVHSWVHLFFSVVLFRLLSSTEVDHDLLFSAFS
jgi:hypothetical protein